MSGSEQRGSQVYLQTHACVRYPPGTEGALGTADDCVYCLRKARDTAEQERDRYAGELGFMRNDLANAKHFQRQAEAQLAAVDAERIALQQEVEELRATIGTLDAL